MVKFNDSDFGCQQNFDSYIWLCLTLHSVLSSLLFASKTCSNEAPNITHFPVGFPSFTGRSPLFGHFSTTLLGLDTIRAFGVEEVFTDQMNSYQDAHTRAWFTFISTSAWLSYRLDILCVIFISFVALVSPALKSCKL